MLGRAQQSGHPGNGRRRRHVQSVGAAVRRPARLQGRRRGVRGADRGRRPAGARQDRALLPAFLAVQGAADLPCHAAMVHPHGRAGAHPRKGPARDRRHACSCRIRAATASARWSPRGRTGASAASAPGACRSRSSCIAQPASRCAIQTVVAPHRRGFHRRRRRRLVLLAAVALPRQRPEPGRLRTGARHRRCLVRVRLDPRLRAGRRGICPGRPICIWKAPTSIAAGSIPRCWNRSAPAASRRSRRCSPTASSTTSTAAKCPNRSAMSPRPHEVADKYGADILRLWVMMSDTTEDLRIGPEILKQQAELTAGCAIRCAGCWARWPASPKPKRVPVADMPELERYILHRMTELDAKCARRWRATTGPACIPKFITSAPPTCRRSISTSARTRSIATGRTACAAAPRGPCWTICTAACAPGSPRCCASPPRRPGPPASAKQDSVHLHLFPDAAARWRDDALAAKWERSATSAAASPCRSRKPAAPTSSAPRCRPSVTLNLAPDEAELLNAAEWAEIAIVSTCDVGAGDGDEPARNRLAPGRKCARCWRVLPEVGTPRGASRRCACAAPTRSSGQCQPAA